LAALEWDVCALKCKDEHSCPMQSFAQDPANLHSILGCLYSLSSRSISFMGYAPTENNACLQSHVPATGGDSLRPRNRTGFSPCSAGHWPIAAYIFLRIPATYGPSDTIVFHGLIERLQRTKLGGALPSVKKQGRWGNSARQRNRRAKRLK